MTRKEKVLGGLWGSVVGDALGVPVEFLDREQVRQYPVTEMRGYGSHNQPPGTWSDDSSLLISTVVSLMGGYDIEAMGRQFVHWYKDFEWCPHGEPFDIGMATSDALLAIEHGTPASKSGGADVYSNGNGSLMRMIPIPLFFANEPPESLLERVQDVSAITHAHPRSKMVCGLFSILVRELLQGGDPHAAYIRATRAFAKHYDKTDWQNEFLNLRTLADGNIGELPEHEIRSGGYVVDTLTAAIWCVLTTRSFADAVLQAVNLGGDTDTTGCVTGGLAGVIYGVDAIPEEWITALARKDDLHAEFERFANRAVANGAKTTDQAAEVRILYRPVGSEELRLIEQSGWAEFPPRLPEQPIFYPVLNEEYAREIAERWNVPASGSGHVTRFAVRADYANRFERRVVGSSRHEELWVPADQLAEFNRNLVGLIEVIAKFEENEEDRTKQLAGSPTKEADCQDKKGQ